MKTTTLNTKTGEGNAPRETYRDDPSVSRSDYIEELNRVSEGNALAFSQLAKALDAVTAQRDELLAALKDIDAIADFMRAQLVKASQFTHADQAVEIRLTIKRAIAKAQGTISG